MGVPNDCDPCLRTFEAVRSALAPIGIEVVAVAIHDSTAASTGRNDVDLMDSGYGIAYPDGASLLRQLVDFSGFSRTWLPPGVATAIDRLDRLSGPARDEAAARLAVRLATRDVPVISYGYDSVGALVSNRLGCDEAAGELDLTRLCVATD